MLKLWGRRNSINVQKVSWTIAELSIPVERIDAGMSHGIVTEARFKAMNPNGLIPTIDDDGVVLWESNTIVRYLAAKHAPAGLMPADPVARAKAEMWMDWQQTSPMQGLSPLFLGLIRTPPERRDSVALAHAAKLVEASMSVLDSHLATSPYVVGKNLTVADIPLGCVVYRWFTLPIERPEYRHVRAWYDRLAARPAFAEHVMLPLT